MSQDHIPMTRGDVIRCRELAGDGYIAAIRAGDHAKVNEMTRIYNRLGDLLKPSKHNTSALLK